MGVPQSDVDRYGFPSGWSHRLHPVRIARQFALGEFLVTRKQYATFVQETGHGGSGCFATPFDTPLLKFDVARSWRDPGFAQGDDDPVVCVNWYDAIAYAGWLSKKTGQNYRLPTDAEWEYAGRAGAATGRYFGDAPIREFANVRDRSKRLLYSAGQFFNECDGGFSNTSPVGIFPPNGFGLYDMLGNVREWVEDCATISFADAPSDGTSQEAEPCMMRMMRGASWNSTERYLYTVGISASNNPDLRRETDGFRIARDYPAPAAAAPGSPTGTQAASPATPSPGAPESSDWDGTWLGAWGGTIAVKILISEGNVVEYDYSGYPQQGLGQTIISGNTLTFRTQRGSSIRLTKNGSTTAAAYYDGPLSSPMFGDLFGKADLELVRGAPQSSDWDGTWLGAWRGEAETVAKIIISGGNVLEHDYYGFPQPVRGRTIISEDTLTFGTPPRVVITLTRNGLTTAAAHYHNIRLGEVYHNSRRGEVDGVFVRQ
jgi:sulfatase modifying factor 1